MQHAQAHVLIDCVLQLVALWFAYLVFSYLAFLYVSQNVS